MRRLARVTLSSFIQGLLVLLPLLVTIYLVIFLYRLVNNIVDDALLLLPIELRGIPLVEIGTKGLAAGVLFVLIAAMGLVARTMFGRAAVGSMDRFFRSIPVLATVYTSTRQVVDVLGGRRERFFTHPILVEYPADGIWAVAFNTGPLGPALSPEPGQEHLTVFIPTTPNPTSGVFAIVPHSRIRPLNLSVEDAMKLILTGGVIKPEPLALVMETAFQREMAGDEEAAVADSGGSAAGADRGGNPGDRMVGFPRS
jgi:uncharacterized membrane protein